MKNHHRGPVIANHKLCVLLVPENCNFYHGSPEAGGMGFGLEQFGVSRMILLVHGQPASPKCQGTV